MNLSGYRISGNLQNIERWPDIRSDTGYPALEISRVSGIRYPAKKVSVPTLLKLTYFVDCSWFRTMGVNSFSVIEGRLSNETKDKINITLGLSNRYLKSIENEGLGGDCGVGCFTCRKEGGIRLQIKGL